MVTGSTHASHCVTQPNYATETKNYYAHKSMPKKQSYNKQVAFENFHRVYLKFPWVFPEFSRIKKSLSFPGFPVFPEL